MILKDDFLSVTIGGLDLWSGTTGRRPEYVLDEDAIDGWYDGASVKRVATVRPNVWGDFSEQGLRNARLITLTGSAIARNSDELHGMRDSFMRVLSHGGYEEMTVQNSTDVRYINVGLEAQPKWLQKLDIYAAFQMTLYAPDPRMYSAPNRVQITTGTYDPWGNRGSGMEMAPMRYPLDYRKKEGPRTEIRNWGNVDSWPIFEVHGTYPSGFVVGDHRGWRVVYRGAVGPSSPVTIDMARGTAIQNGWDRSINISVRDYFSIPAGQIVRPYFEPITPGNGFCDIIWRHTWI
jgi:hypothetical protein